MTRSIWSLEVTTAESLVRSRYAVLTSPNIQECTVSRQAILAATSRHPPLSLSSVSLSSTTLSSLGTITKYCWLNVFSKAVYCPASISTWLDYTNSLSKILLVYRQLRMLQQELLHVLIPYWPSHVLRSSSSSNLLQVLTIILFSVPDLSTQLSNYLEPSSRLLHSSGTFQSFMRQLKTHLFQAAFYTP